MGSGQGKVVSAFPSQYGLARTRSGGGGGGSEADPIEISSPSPSPQPRTRRQITKSTRINKSSGKIKKLSPPARPAPRPPTASSKAVAQKPSTRGRRGKSPRRILRSPSPPDSVPIVLQLSLNSTVQNLLERTVFYWTKQWIPQALEKKGWKEPEQMELSYWFRVFNETNLKSRIERALVDSHSGLSYTGLRALMNNLHQIRHAAVHRLSLSTPVLRDLMADAIRITDCMDDPLRNKKIREMQKKLIRNDMAGLENLINTPLEEFESKVTSSEATSNKEEGEGAVLKPATNMQVGIAGDVVSNPAPEDKRAENIREAFFDATQKARAALGMEIGNSIRELIGSSLQPQEKQVPPSVEREFGSRRENMRLAANNTQGRGQSSTSNKFSRREVIDLTEDGDDGLQDTKHELASKESAVLEAPLTSNKRLFAAFEQDLVEISDDDQAYPKYQENEADEDEEPMIFSNAPRRLPHKKSKGPQHPLRMGVDY